MPISVCCPECQRAYALAEHLGGKRVVCAGCQTAFDVPAADTESVPLDPAGISARPLARRGGAGEPVPARQSRRWDDDDADLPPPPRQRSKGLLFVAVAGGLIVLVCAGLGVSWFLMRSAPPAPGAEPAADQPAAARGGPMLAGPPPAGVRGRAGNNDAQASFNRGNTLFQQNKFREAEAAYREALQLQPDFAEAHCNLGHALRDQGRYAEALVALRRGRELGSQRPGWPYQAQAQDWVTQCEQLIAVERKLPAVLAGSAEPANDAERAQMIYMCVGHKQLPLAGARLAAAVSADAPPPNELVRYMTFYNGACGAALAVAGTGKDARQVPDKVALLLRRQALRWLRGELARQAEKLEGAAPPARGPIQRELAHWQKDTDLVAVRDADALSRLPGDERRQWQQLWDDVAALRVRAEAAN